MFDSNKNNNVSVSVFYAFFYQAYQLATAEVTTLDLNAAATKEAIRVSGSVEASNYMLVAYPEYMTTLFRTNRDEGGTIW